MDLRKQLIKILLSCLTVFSVVPAYSQAQICPANINFSNGDLSFWAARTGLVNGAFLDYPAPNNGVTNISEFNISTPGIRVITSSFADLYGGFQTIPNINGYSYDYSIQLGSTSTSWDLRAGVPNPGGFTRSVTYTINVPAGSPSVPFTMTYAYAMVLENGTHNSDEQPLFKATLSTVDSVITCASPQYYLPTFNNTGTGGVGATLDTAAALANGFSNSPVLFLSHAGASNGNGNLLQDVWYKSWTEVTFDLSAYRGRQVNLTFESDNCAPGAHFAYAYVALRNTCAGLEISGNPAACTNNAINYSVPALAGAVYNWTIPPGWVMVSGSNTNIITVIPGNGGGQITAHEINGCADLRDTLDVTTAPPTIPGVVNGSNTVCSGTNSSTLTLSGQTGNVLQWISSLDGVNWTPINFTGTVYTAQNLTASTYYSALIQNGSACKVDTAAFARIIVDPKSVGGVLSPAQSSFCLGQNTNTLFTLSGHTGAVQNWQQSNDFTNWAGFIPAYTNATYAVSGITASTQYRVVVKSGVCPADTSTVAAVTYYNVPFPAAAINPPNASICYGKSVQLNADISIGTSYTWSNANTLTNQGNGTITTLPYLIRATATPFRTTDYVLTVINAGCPNPLRDTFHVLVAPRIIVNAGNDTSIVATQPLQLNATANDPTATAFNWIPSTGLSATNIYNPVATLGPEYGEHITYIVRATNPAGCFGEDNITVTIFKTGPDIFVPNAFTPNNDGLNDVLKPICVGIKELQFFRIFNRWGQEVYATSQIGQGWDGKIKSVTQGTGTFVYMVQGTDYTGRKIFRKGNITLIR